LIVLDASCVVEVVLNERHAEAVRLRIGDPQTSLHAPHLLDVEVTQVVRRKVLADEIDAERGLDALLAFANLDITYYPHGLLLGRVWDLRHNMTAYDALYVALAEALGTTLLTTDARLAAAIDEPGRVELIGA
jgi:predicted nucleic acid-binding protein